MADLDLGRQAVHDLTGLRRHIDQWAALLGVGRSSDPRETLDAIGQLVQRHAADRDEACTGWQQRVIADEASLAKKVDLLGAFLDNSDKVAALDRADIVLLDQQLVMMRGYLAILRARVVRF